jgi:hypothetical protein
MVFFYSSKKYEENKTHNMLSFTLDPRFKSLRLVSFLIGKKMLFPLWKNMIKVLNSYAFKCYHTFHLMVEFRLEVNMQIDEESSFNIFEMSVGINEPMKEVVNEL